MALLKVFCLVMLAIPTVAHFSWNTDENSENHYFRHPSCKFSYGLKGHHSHGTRPKHHQVHYMGLQIRGSIHIYHYSGQRVETPDRVPKPSHQENMKREVEEELRAEEDEMEQNIQDIRQEKDEETREAGREIKENQETGEEDQETGEEEVKAKEVRESELEVKSIGHDKMEQMWRIREKVQGRGGMGEEEVEEIRGMGENVESRREAEEEKFEERGVGQKVEETNEVLQDTMEHTTYTEKKVIKRNKVTKKGQEGQCTILDPDGTVHYYLLTDRRTERPGRVAESLSQGKVEEGKENADEGEEETEKTREARKKVEDNEEVREKTEIAEDELGERGMGNENMEQEVEETELEMSDEKVGEDMERGEDSVESSKQEEEEEKSEKRGNELDIEKVMLILEAQLEDRKYAGGNGGGGGMVVEDSYATTRKRREGHYVSLDRNGFIRYYRQDDNKYVYYPTVLYELPNDEGKQEEQDAEEEVEWDIEEEEEEEEEYDDFGKI